VAESWRLHTLTSFPFVLVISQWKTEGILAQFVEDRGIKVLRPLKVSGIAEVDDSQALGYKFVVTMESGQTVKAKYIIGADGSRSTVRVTFSVCENLNFLWNHRFDPPHR
jgi:2-polyprenyl-6-methoxyphenol hydroxylase-like FAD-dependent oxidoreductase